LIKTKEIKKQTAQFRTNCFEINLFFSLLWRCMIKIKTIELKCENISEIPEMGFEEQKITEGG